LGDQGGLDPVADHRPLGHFLAFHYLKHSTILLTSGKIYLPRHCCRPLAEPDPVYPYFLFFTTPSAQEASDKYHKIIFANGAASTRPKKILLPRRSPEGRIRLKKTPGPGGPGGFQVFGSWFFWLGSAQRP
jgi:hypothetical protein